MTTLRVLTIGCLGIGLLSHALFWHGAAAGQAPAGYGASGPPTAWSLDLRASCVVVPQVSGYRWRGAGRPAVAIEHVRAHALLADGIAVTTLEIALYNPGDRDEEVVLLLPVPAGATVSGFEFAGTAAEPRMEILPVAVASATYREIVARLRDPALLEFVGHGLVRSSVFPVSARGRQQVRMRYEHVLERDGDRFDYVLPRSESLATRAPWQITTEITGRHPVATIYSPSHELHVVRRTDRHAHVTAAGSPHLAPGPFRLSVLRATGGGLAASLLAYPDPVEGGGLFLLMMGLPDGGALSMGSGASVSSAPAARGGREVILVLDRSGSMAGAKMEHARAAALRVLEDLGPRDCFNIIDYSHAVGVFAPSPVPRTDEALAAARTHLARLVPTGGTNLHDAVLEALRQPGRDGALSLVLLLTDGIPTIGRTEEADFHALIARANPRARRLFTLGLGSDVNAPLLDALAERTRGTSHYVLAGADLEPTVAKLSKRLKGPVLTDLALTALGPGGDPAPAAVRDVLPALLPDLYEGDQLVVLGRYLTHDALRFELRGLQGDETRVFRCAFGLERASVRNAFVARLWASRQIATLSDLIRQQGGVGPGQPGAATALGGPHGHGAASFAGSGRASHGSGAGHPAGRAAGGHAGGPATGELVDEILRLSTRYGVLSEYTAFLAREGTDLARWDHLNTLCADEYRGKAAQVRTGVGAITQAWNLQAGKGQLALNPTNAFVGPDQQRVELTTVQQLHDRCFFQRGPRWIDSRLITRTDGHTPDETVVFGSARYFELVEELAARGHTAFLALQGEILLEIGGKRVLIVNP